MTRNPAHTTIHLLHNRTKILREYFQTGQAFLLQLEIFIRILSEYRMKGQLLVRDEKLFILPLSGSTSVSTEASHRSLIALPRMAFLSINSHRSQEQSVFTAPVCVNSWLPEIAELKALH